MSRFSRQISQGLARVATVAAVRVTYTRGESAFTINATPGKSDFKSEQHLNVVAESRTRDWIVRTDALLVDGQPIRPQRGDTVTDQSGQVFTVARPDGNEQPWRYSDQGQTYIRIHTRLKGSA